MGTSSNKLAWSDRTNDIFATGQGGSDTVLVRQWGESKSPSGGGSCNALAAGADENSLIKLRSMMVKIVSNLNRCDGGVLETGINHG